MFVRTCIFIVIFIHFDFCTKAANYVHYSASWMVHPSPSFLSTGPSVDKVTLWMRITTVEYFIFTGKISPIFHQEDIDFNITITNAYSSVIILISILPGNLWCDFVV